MCNRPPVSMRHHCIEGLYRKYVGPGGPPGPGIEYCRETGRRLAAGAHVPFVAPFGFHLWRLRHDCELAFINDKVRGMQDQSSHHSSHGAHSLSRSKLLAFAIPVLIATLLRFPLLAQRPMHCDEAVHADKFGILLEQGKYEYSTVDFHGPTLYYATLLAAKLTGAARYTEISENTLRMVPAAAGVLLVAAHVLLIPYIGFPAAFCAALLAAISPAMAYYSRYYIHETLFVLFTFCAMLFAFRYSRLGGAASAIGVGLCLGLMYATKETVIIAGACMALAALLLLSVNKMRGEAPPGITVQGKHVVMAAATAILTAVLLFSSFLSHPAGVFDSVLAYRTYFWRGAGQATLHQHPWHYYLNLLLYFRENGGPIWTEGLIVALAFVGGTVAFLKNPPGMNPNVPRFLAIYTLLMVVTYSLIPYKAPWNLLGLLHGLILLAGMGAVYLIRVFRKPAARGLVVALLLAAALHLGWQAWACSFRYAADPCNPWVYAHTGEDVFTIVRQLEGLARVHPEKLAMPVQIISRENLWPLPWYLRRFTAVRWWNGVSVSAPSAPVIFITPDMEPALIRKLYELPPPGQREMYMSIFDRYVELRPQVELRGYASKSLWDEYQRLKPSSDPGSAEITK